MLKRNTSQQLDPKVPDRQAELNAWLILRGWRKQDLAHQLGAHPSMITYIFRGERRTAARIAQLVGLGIPARLLPEFGPRPCRPPSHTARPAS